MRAFVSSSLRLCAGLLFVTFTACSRATTPAPAAAPASAPVADALPGAAVFGNWARTPADCKRPEFQLAAAAVALQTDGDGTPVTFTFRKVAWATDAQGQVTVDLNEPHPYGKTALTFKLVGADAIELVQRTHPVPLHRCPAH